MKIASEVREHLGGVVQDGKRASRQPRSQHGLGVGRFLGAAEQGWGCGRGWAISAIHSAVQRSTLRSRVGCEWSSSVAVFLENKGKGQGLPRLSGKRRTCTKDSRSRPVSILDSGATAGGLRCLALRPPIIGPAGVLNVAVWLRNWKR